MTNPAGRRKFFSQCACCEPTPTFGAAVSRRNFLSGSAAAMGLGLTTAATPSPAQAPTKPRRIDVHHHVVPPMQLAALGTNRSANTDNWTVAKSLDDMDKAGVATSITSIINPGVWFGKVDEAARKLARGCNEWAAKLEQDHPGRFKTFAVIPLPDTEGSLREIEYALDVLKAEGIALWTVYSGKYLGDPAFLPVFEELNRRKAVVYTHPTVPDCCNNLIKGLPVSTLEYNHDTTRTIASLCFGEGTTALRCPDIKFIWSHAGGTLPFLTSRFEDLVRRRKDQFPGGAVAMFRRFYYEVAQGNTPGMLDALLRMVPVSQVMFGSDYPYREAVEARDGLAAYKFSEADLRAIEYENAIKMMPRLKAS
jgi:predicted TIM-barrel fold metal-dependent hydrolase